MFVKVKVFRRRHKMMIQIPVKSKEQNIIATGEDGGATDSYHHYTEGNLHKRLYLHHCSSLISRPWWEVANSALKIQDSLSSKELPDPNCH